MTAFPDLLVGRSAETAAIDQLLLGARQGQSRVLVIRGEAGIGKSALLGYAASCAEGMTVLRGAGIQGESELAYAALHQILRPVFDRIEALPDPQAAALRAAFALSAETVDERFRVSLGVLALLSEVAEERPALILVDDAQWLDQPSADALVFVARRLEAEALAVIFAARDDGRPFVAPGLTELSPEPLDALDACSLLAGRLGSAVAPRAVEWVVENAHGNPLAILELPTSLTSSQLAGRDPLTRTLPPATSVEHVYLARVDQLSSGARSVLLLAAAEEAGTRATVERAARELEVSIDELAEAEAAGLVHVDAEQIVFRHPLVRSAVYRSSAFTDRERAHRVLADASALEGSPDRAAWHRAAATVGTDDDVASELESTAERARLRGGHSAAASALERAADLSADTASRARRLVAAAHAAWHAGQPDRATTLLGRTDRSTAPPRLRADIDHLHGLIQLRCGGLLDAFDTLMGGAASAAQVDARKAIEMLFDAGEAAAWAGDLSRVAQAQQQTAALPRGTHPKTRFSQSCSRARSALGRGRPRTRFPGLAISSLAPASSTIRAGSPGRPW